MTLQDYNKAPDRLQAFSRIARADIVKFNYGERERKFEREVRQKLERWLSALPTWMVEEKKKKYPESFLPVDVKISESVKNVMFAVHGFKGVPAIMLQNGEIIRGHEKVREFIKNLKND